MQVLLAAAAGLALAVIGHILALRLGARHLSAYGVSLVAGLAAVPIALLLMGASDFSGSLLVAILFFCAWWFLFLNFFQSSQSSLRVNILRQIARHGGTLEGTLLHARYNDAVLVQLRVARLTQRGTVVERDSRYFVASPSLRLLARFFRFLKLAIIGRTSEFY